jgi:HAD domain in Swiss Army Knife RNA repair proteins
LSYLEKILFLDFDGVLHSTTSPPHLLFSKAKLLADLLSKNPCKIIISSSWRFHYEIESIKERLPKPISNLVHGVTGEPHIGKWPRYNEIKNYMIDQNKLADWRALDDSFLEFPNYCDELILCHGKEGIEQKQLNELSIWLLN